MPTPLSPHIPPIPPPSRLPIQSPAVTPASRRSPLPNLGSSVLRVPHRHGVSPVFTPPSLPPMAGPSRRPLPVEVCPLSGPFLFHVDRSMNQHALLTPDPTQAIAPRRGTSGGGAHQPAQRFPDPNAANARVRCVLLFISPMLISCISACQHPILPPLRPVSPSCSHVDELHRYTSPRLWLSLC